MSVMFRDMFRFKMNFNGIVIDTFSVALHFNLGLVNSQFTPFS